MSAARRSEGRTLLQLMRDNARELPDAPALKSKHAGIWRTKTWREVYGEVRRLARGLATIGLARGDVVALVSENVEEQWLLEFATVALGAVSVTIYPDASADEVGYALGHARAVVVLAEDQEQVDKILACPVDAIAGIRHIVTIDGRGLWDYAEPRLVPIDALREAGDASSLDIDAEIDRASASDVAVYCYTSGTTGRPKAAMLSHAFLLDNAHRLMGALEIEPGGNYLSYISPAWAAEQFYSTGLALLAPLVVHFAEKPETVQADLRDIGPQFLMFTPRQWEMLASNIESRMMDAGPLRQRLYRWGVAQGVARARGDGGGLSRAILWPLADLLVLKGVRDLLGLTRAKAVLSGGSGLSAELFERFRAFGIPLGNLYGSSEMGLITTHRPGSRTPWTLGSFMPSDPSIAPPIEGWVAPDGELRLKVLAFSGYLHDPEATAAMGESAEGYRTGDAVRLDGEELIFLDRLKDMRRLSGGQTYPPQFIENHLRADAMIRDAIVIGDEGRDCVVALVNIDAEIAGRFAEVNGLAYGTFPELSQLEPVRREVGRAIARVNGFVDPHARVAAFANLPKELDPDEAELTRSRKPRREQIHARYGAIIEALYRGDETLETEIDVKYRDGTSGRLVAEVALNRLEDTRSLRGVAA